MQPNKINAKKCTNSNTMKREESDLFLGSIWINFHALSLLKHLQLTKLPCPTTKQFQKKK